MILQHFNNVIIQLLKFKELTVLIEKSN